MVGGILTRKPSWKGAGALTLPCPYSLCEVSHAESARLGRKW
jgi:hypothetical protein